MSALLTIDHLTKYFPGQPQAAVSQLNMAVEQGEILALLGPSGCGKTTTLRMIAGFEHPDSGDIRIQGHSLLPLSTQERKIGMVFQDYALFPHWNLLDNIRFAMKHIGKTQQLARAESWLELVGLAGLGKRMPHELSGGQQQRVALARTLAAEPKLVLLDEPFSNLDAALRESTRNEVRRILKANGATAILVTHDQAEALSFADHIGVMNLGQLQQLGSPEDIYLQPNCAFVAEFLGHTNLVQAVAHHGLADTSLGQLTLNASVSGPVTLSLRPEQLCLTPSPLGQGVVLGREFRGHDYFYLVEQQGQLFKVITPYQQRYEVDSRVQVSSGTQGVILNR